MTTNTNTSKAITEEQIKQLALSSKATSDKAKLQAIIAALKSK